MNQLERLDRADDHLAQARAYLTNYAKRASPSERAIIRQLHKDLARVHDIMSTQLSIDDNE